LPPVAPKASEIGYRDRLLVSRDKPGLWCLSTVIKLFIRRDGQRRVVKRWQIVPHPFVCE
jgi:hypothetical protein